MPKVYTEGLEGSLQVELLTATRREGRLPILVRPSTEALIDVVASGHPVLVLQNLRLRRSPRWHYAVVVGFENETSRVILRSGAERRKRQRARRFAASWSLADNWGFVVADPGTIPYGVDAGSYMRAVVESERLLGEGDIKSAYLAAMSRWPDESIVVFLAAGHEYNQGRLQDARSLYRHVLAIEPDHVAARNNLANVLLAQGCYEAAAAEAKLALAQDSSAGPFRDAIVETLGSIQAARTDGGGERTSDAACS